MRAPTFKPECLPCLFSIRSREILECIEDDGARMRALGRLGEYLLSASLSSRIDEVAHESFRLVKALTGCPDPESRAKREAMDFFLKILPRVLEDLDRLSGYRRFRMAVLASINANLIDVGTIYHRFTYEEVAEQLFSEEGLEIDHIRPAYNFLKKARSIAILFDNAGEAVIDAALSQAIRAEGIRVTGVAKEYPYQNDVTLRDMVEAGLEKYFDELIDTGSDAPSLMEEYVDSSILEAVWSHDLVIAKGMAHLETLLYVKPRKPILHLLVAKCRPNAMRIEVSVGGKVALLRLA